VSSRKRVPNPPQRITTFIEIRRELRRSRFRFEVDAFQFDHMGPFLDLGVDGPDILAENADEEKLHRTEKEKPDLQRRQPEAEAVPVKQLENQIAQGDEEAQERNGEAERGGRRQRG